MKNLTTLYAILSIATVSFVNLAGASEVTITKITKVKHLILALDNKDFANHFARTDTYTSQLYPQGPIKTSLIKDEDPISKKLSDASKALKRLTSIHYGKSQKIRAKIGKESVTLRYTHIL